MILLHILAKGVYGHNCKKKAELDAQGIEYYYFDLDTAEGLAEAAYQGILGGKISLPIILTEADSQEKDSDLIRLED